jgi:tRNA(fMet)-specific endonuclease VapC
MNGSVVDTNVIIRMLNGDNEAIETLEKIEKVFVPIVVVGELFYGAYKSARKDENMALFTAVLSTFEILPVDEATAVSYALIKTDLTKNAIKIPENDLWIAATAHANDLTLATFDSHFENISMIKIAGV